MRLFNVTGNPWKAGWLLSVAFISMLCQWQWKITNISELFLGHPLAFYKDFIDEDTAKELLDVVKVVKSYPTNANDLTYHNRIYEDVGEAELANSNGTCNNPMLIPSKDKKKCVLAGRFDVAYHYVKFGGIEGLKERYESLVSRMQSFGRYLFDLEEFPVMKRIFNSPEFLTEAKRVCPTDKQFLDPFQYHIIIQVPGQTVPIHLDAPWFTTASRFQYPVWLLVVMAASGLYQEQFIDQIQVVVNLHQWNNTKFGGKFAYYTKQSIKPSIIEPFPRSATIIDGAKTIHATTLYRKDKRVLTQMPKNAENKLEHDSDDVWLLKSNSQVVDSFLTHDLRITVVYRARCFETPEAAHDYKVWLETASLNNIRPVADIMNELKVELARRQHTDLSVINRMSTIDLAIALIEEFINYPKPWKSIIPYNYCAYTKTHPSTKPWLRYLC